MEFRSTLLRKSARPGGCGSCGKRSADSTFPASSHSSTATGPFLKTKGGRKPLYLKVLNYLSIEPGELQFHPYESSDNVAQTGHRDRGTARRLSSITGVAVTFNTTTFTLESEVVFVMHLDTLNIVQVPSTYDWLSSALPPWTNEAKGVITRRPEGITLEARQGSELVGCAGYLPDPGGAELLYIGIRPNYKRRGIATSLYSFIEDALLSIYPQDQTPTITAHTPHGMDGEGAQLLRCIVFSSSNGIGW